jgi:DNA polymerase/3'-5' exonuclease PolX
MTMNAASIAIYIAKLETENKDLRAKVESLTQDKTVDYEYASDSESVASNDAADAEWIESDSDSDTESITSNEVGDDEFFVSYNRKLTYILYMLSFYEIDEHKKKAYEDAAHAIYKLPFKVTDGDELARGPNKVPGIGKSIAAKINEFLETGKVKCLQDMKRMFSAHPLEKLTKAWLTYPVKKMEKECVAVDETHDDYFAGGHNDDLVRHLKNMASEESDEFKAAAYEKAANAIDALNFKVTNGEELAKGPKKVPGIGKSIARKIDDFLAPPKKVSFELESNPVSTNEEIAWHLDVLASLEAEEHGSQDPHKIRAYRNAAEAIRDLDFEVTNGTEISQGPKKVKGIGKSIARKIDELIVTGKIQRIRDLSE